MAFSDLRYALRTLSKSRGFTLVTVATLAIGIGANTAIFAAIRAAFLRPLPYPDGDRIVRIWESMGPGWQGSVSEENLSDWQEQTQTIADFTAVVNDSFNLAIDAPERIQGQAVTDGFFRLFGVQPMLGRAFTADEMRPGQGRAVVLGHGLWRRQFGADPKIVGKAIDLSGKSYTVAGVMPQGFAYPGSPAELWVPLALEKTKGRGSHYLTVMGRLRPGVTLEAARADLDAITGRLAQAYPDTNTNRGAFMQPLREQFVGQIRAVSAVLVGAVMLVLLIGCVNVANLLLARASRRRGEIAVRMALGASRTRLIRQLLTESFVLAGLGAAVGILVALWGADALQAVMSPEMRSLFPIRVDGQVLGFAAGAAFASALLFGLVPAFQSSRADLSAAVKEGSTRTGSTRSRFKKALVVVEVTMSVILLVGSGLLIRSMARFNDVSLGFDPEHLLTMKIALPQVRYPKPTDVATFHERLLERVQTLPGVASASVVNFTPLASDNWNGGFEIVGRAAFEHGKEPITEFLIASPDYFRTMGVPVTSGRAFTRADRAGAPGVVIVNETFAKRHLPGVDPLQQRITVMNDTYQIVGVVADMRRWGKTREPVPESYFPAWQGAFDTMTLVVRTSGDPMALAGAVRAEVQAVDPSQAVYAVKSMNDIIFEAASLRRFETMLFGLFGAIALVLASLGIYGVMTYHVNQRSQEMGIRMALGARSGQIQAMVVREGMTLCALGLAMGVVGAIALSFLLESLLFGVGKTDPVSYVAAAGVFSGVALAACWLPARRATRVDPIKALRAS